MRLSPGGPTKSQQRRKSSKSGALGDILGHFRVIVKLWVGWSWPEECGQCRLSAMRALRSHTRNASAQLEQRRVELPPLEEFRGYVADFWEFLAGGGTFRERKSLIRNFVEGIEVVGDEAMLTYTVPMPNDGVTSESGSVLSMLSSLSPRRRTPPEIFMSCYPCFGEQVTDLYRSRPLSSSSRCRRRQLSVRPEAAPATKKS